jgi:hypothetical protein
VAPGVEDRLRATCTIARVRPGPDRSGLARRVSRGVVSTTDSRRRAGQLARPLERVGIHGGRRVSARPSARALSSASSQLPFS